MILASNLRFVENFRRIFFCSDFCINFGRFFCKFFPYFFVNFAKKFRHNFSRHFWNFVAIFFGSLDRIFENFPDNFGEKILYNFKTGTSKTGTKIRLIGNVIFKEVQ